MINVIEEMSKKTQIDETLEKVRKGIEVIPGTTDIVFKTIMMEHEDYLCFIISQVTGIPYDSLYGHIQFRNVEHVVSKAKEKHGRSDIIVEIQDMRIVVEMNTGYYKDLLNKNLYYAEHASLFGLKENDAYYDMKKVLLISLDLEKIRNFPDDGEIIRTFALLEKKKHYPYNDQIEMSHLALDKIREKYYNKEELNELERGVLIMTERSLETLEDLASGNEMLGSVKDHLKSLSQLGDIFTDYEREMMARWEENSIRRDIEEEAKETGMKEGMEKGLAAGMEKGMADGMEKVAKEMLADHVPVSDISKWTKLSLEEIEQIKKEVK